MKNVKHHLKIRKKKKRYSKQPINTNLMETGKVPKNFLEKMVI